MARAFILPLRLLQALFALLVLALTAAIINNFNTYNPGYYPYGPSNPDYTYWLPPSSLNFLLFVSVWTLLAVAYLAIAPTRFPAAAHKFAIFGVEGLTMIFWFAGWVALAVYLGDLWRCWGWACRCAVAAVIFGAFNWLLFVVTTIMAATHVWNTRGTRESSHDPKMEVHQGV